MKYWVFVQFSWPRYVIIDYFSFECASKSFQGEKEIYRKKSYVASSLFHISETFLFSKTHKFNYMTSFQQLNHIHIRLKSFVFHENWVQGHITNQFFRSSCVLRIFHQFFRDNLEFFFTIRAIDVRWSVTWWKIQNSLHIKVFSRNFPSLTTFLIWLIDFEERISRAALIYNQSYWEKKLKTFQGRTEMKWERSEFKMFCL